MRNLPSMQARDIKEHWQTRKWQPRAADLDLPPYELLVSVRVFYEGKRYRIDELFDKIRLESGFFDVVVKGEVYCVFNKPIAADQLIRDFVISYILPSSAQM
jgi:hypothetical protein